MFFDPFEPLINVLILPANSLALFLVQKLRERRNGIRILKGDKTIDNDRVKKLLDLLTEKQFLSVDESGRYAISQNSDDYDF